MKNIEDIVKCIHLKGTKLCVGDIIMDVNYDKFRKRIFEVVEVGNDIDHVSRAYDFWNALCIITNLIVSILFTFSEIRAQYGTFLRILEEITVIGFL